MLQEIKSIPSQHFLEFWRSKQKFIEMYDDH